jgi:hypothetical protein
VGLFKGLGGRGSERLIYTHARGSINTAGTINQKKAGGEVSGFGSPAAVHAVGAAAAPVLGWAPLRAMQARAGGRAGARRPAHGAARAGGR